MTKRSLLNDDELKNGAESIAADMTLPDGRVLKLARVIDDHLDWFDKARRRGLEWSDIVAVLYKAGVKRGDGRPLSRGHVSSLVWRKQQAGSPVAAGVVENSVAQSDQIRPPKHGTENNRTIFATVPEPALPASSQRPDPPAKRRQKTVRKDDISSASDDAASDQDKMLAFMRRSARLRDEE